MNYDDNKILASEVVKDIDSIKKSLDDGLEISVLDELVKKVKTSIEILDELSSYCKEITGPDRILNMSLNIFLKESISVWKKKFWSIDLIGASEGTLEIECSKIGLKRAIENLILNSMEAGASEVILNVKKDCIEISDDGPGITAEAATEIKERGTTKEPGRGFGLKMVKAFFSSMNWNFELKNKNDGGLLVILKKGVK